MDSTMIIPGITIKGNTKGLETLKNISNEKVKTDLATSRMEKAYHYYKGLVLFGLSHSDSEILDGKGDVETIKVFISIDCWREAIDLTGEMTQAQKEIMVRECKGRIWHYFDHNKKKGEK